MRKSFRTLVLLPLLALCCSGISAQSADDNVTDVNSITELKGKSAGTYRLNLQASTMVYGAFNDDVSGTYLYLWDGDQGIRINGEYEGKIKQAFDANPVGKALKGTILLNYSPGSINGYTAICNTPADFNATVGDASQTEPKPVTISDINGAVGAANGPIEYAYVKVHGYTSYINGNKFMYDENGDSLILSNPTGFVSADEFNAQHDNMKGTFKGAVSVIRDKGSILTVYLAAMGSDWFDAEGPIESTSVTLDADTEYNSSANYSKADVTVKGLSFKKDIPAIVNFPFAMTADHITSNFGEGTKLYYMNNYKGNHKVSTDEATYDLLTYDYSAAPTEATRLYVVVPGKDVAEGTDLKFSDVQISAYASEGYNSYTDWTTYTSIKLKGTYSPKKVSAETCLIFGDDGSLTAPVDSIKGFTGYFEVPASVIKGKGVKVTFDGGGTSSIKSGITDMAASGDGKAYNISGQRVDPGKLKSGIYIMNGKKFVVR